MDGINTNAGMTPADIAAVMNTKNGNGWGNEGGAWWLLVLFLFMFMGMGSGAWGNNAPAPNPTPSIQQGFNQNTLQNGLNGILAQMSNTAMQNMQGQNDIRFAISQENCADRQAMNGGFNNLMMQNTQNQFALQQNMTQGFQSILDKMCQNENDALRREIADLRQQNQFLGLSASQTAQTAQIIGRLAPTPIPAYIVGNPYTGGSGSADATKASVA